MGRALHPCDADARLASSEGGLSCLGVEYPQWLCHEAGDGAGLVQLEPGGDAGLSLHVEAQAPPRLQLEGRGAGRSDGTSMGPMV
jgi:hypothetical protein